MLLVIELALLAAPLGALTANANSGAGAKASISAKNDHRAHCQVQIARTSHAARIVQSLKVKQTQKSGADKGILNFATFAWDHYGAYGQLRHSTILPNLLSADDATAARAPPLFI